MAEFRRGLAAIEDAATRKSSGNFTFIPRIRWREDGESRYVLVLTPIDDVVTALLHEWIPVGKGEKSNGEEFTRWEDFLSRKDDAIGEDYDELEERLERDAKLRCFGVVVELEPEFEEVGGRKKVTGFSVKTEDYTKKGENGDIEMTQPAIGLVVESAMTVWGAIGSLDQSRGPISELPVEIIRRGKDQNTRYDFFPLDVPVDLSNVVEYLDGISYLADDLDEIVERVSAAESDLEAGQIVADAILTKRLTELADGERYEELVPPLKLEDMPAKWGQKGKKKQEKPARKERPERKTKRQVKETPEEPQDEAPAATSKSERFDALKARVEAQKA